MKRILISIVLLPLSAWAVEEPRTLGLAEAFHLAEKSRPEIAAAKAHESASEESVNSLSASYYPSLSAAAVESLGFPGSQGDGFPGIVGSPYRKGPGAELYSKLTLLDFTRSAAVDAAKFEVKNSEEKTDIVRLKLYGEVLRAYLDASRFRANWETWDKIHKEVVRFGDRVKSLVRSGQYSDVARLLLEDQASESEMKAATFRERYATALKRIGLLTGLSENSFSCPSVSEISETSLSIIRPGQSSPIQRSASQEVKAAQAMTSRYSNEYLPKLVLVGSIGVLADARLVDNSFYSAWVGLSVPIFDGFLISSEVHRANAVAIEKENALKAVELSVKEGTLNYEEAVRISRLQMEYLEHQRKGARAALDLAESRYTSFVGTLVDLREAIRNLGRVESQMNDVKADLIVAEGSKLFLNGATVAQ